MTLISELTEVLKTDSRLVSNDELLKNQIVELALKYDKSLIKLLLSNQNTKNHFFINIDKVLIFNKEKFMKFINNKEFLPDSYTSFKNKIGLTLNKRYLTKSREVVLAWPYKDCILEGGQSKIEQKRDEIFYNKILAPDEIDRLLDPKVLTNFQRITADGKQVVKEIKPTDNLIINGNNLLVLHSLKKRFSGKIKLIYIDPPYNTGNDDFKYNDNFNHSTWLTFMKNRLEIAIDLLCDGGVLFVQIDYIEQAYLKVLLDELFLKKGYCLPHITVKTATPAGFKVVNPGLVNVSDQILIFVKGEKKDVIKSGFVKASYQKDYNKFIVNIEENPKNWEIKNLTQVIYEKFGVSNKRQLVSKYGKRVAENLFEKEIEDFASSHANSVFATYGPHKPSPKLKEGVTKSLENRNKIIVVPAEGDGDHYLLNGRLLAFYSNKLKNIDGEIVPTKRMTDFWDDLSWDSLSHEGGVILKNAKKPEALLKRILEISTDPGDIILDFFLGSGTTAAVCHKMSRQYIGVEQLNYGKNSAVVRLTKVIENKDQSGITQIVNWQGGGEFVFCELMKLNEFFIQRIHDCQNTDELFEIWDEAKKSGFLSYRISKELFDKNSEEFKKLTLNGQKKIILDCLEYNELYVNYSEIDDVEYKVSKEDNKLNKNFYKEA